MNRELSQFLALILRHKPEVIDISLDNKGWANVELLIKQINKSGRTINTEILENIVKTDNKNRYSFNEDKTLIRANQGHSVNVDVKLEQLQPPDVLYHGSANKYVESILKNGIIPKTRLYVHLSLDIKTALNVGTRHGFPIIFQIDTKQMHKDGVLFYKSANNVWLTKFIDKKYIKQIDYKT